MKKRHGAPGPQNELFGAGPRPATRDLGIVAQGAQPLGKEQRNFNRLVRQLQGLRARLEEWRAFEPMHRQRIAEELLPLHQRIGNANRELMRTLAGLLEGTVTAGTIGKAERRNLRLYLLDLLVDHLGEHPDEAEFVAVHDRFAERTHAEEQAAERHMALAMAKEMFGIELEDGLADSPIEDIIAEGIDRAREAEAAREEAARQRRGAEPGAGAREARRAAAADVAAKAASQTVREAFRKLASALHPDRAADETDRVRRHALMQRANIAYEAGDLLGLLTLQLEIEQIDADHLAKVPKQRIVHYNSVLREQIREIEQELAFLREELALVLDLPAAQVTIAAAEQGLRAAVANAKQAIRSIRDTRTLLLMPAERKPWLRAWAEERRMNEAFEALMHDAMAGGVMPDFETFDSDDEGFGLSGQRSRGRTSAAKTRPGKRGRG